MQKKIADKSNEEFRKEKEEAQRIEIKLQMRQELSAEEKIFYNNWQIKEQEGI